MTRNVLRLCTAVVLSVCVVGGANGQVPNPPVCDCTLELQAVFLSFFGVSACEDITSFSAVGAVHTLEASNQGITTLKLGDFNDLGNLGALNLDDNQLQTLPAGIFDSLVNTSTIALNDNQLQTLPSGLFDNFTDLRTLGLSNNQLQTLPADIFDGDIFTAVETNIEIRMDGNLFSEGLPLAMVETFRSTRLNTAQIFTDLVPVKGGIPEVLRLPVGSTTVLDLRDAFFLANSNTRARASAYTITGTDDAIVTAGEVDPPTRGGAHNTIITASQSGYADLTIDASAFSGAFTATRTLPVVVGDLPYPPPVVCDLTPQVRDAIVAAIDGVSDCISVEFLSLASIDSLDLSDSGTTALQSSDFIGLTGLTELDLSDNELQTLPADIFDQIPETTARINLHGNPFGDGLPLAVIETLLTVDNVTMDLVAVQDILSTQLNLYPGNAADLDLEDAFIAINGASSSSADPDSYEITTSETLTEMTDTAVIQTERNAHILTITSLADG